MNPNKQRLTLFHRATKDAAMKILRDGSATPRADI